MSSDSQLVAQALAGGQDAFAPIVRRYHSAVFSVALARVRDFHAAEDITQSVFLNAFTQLHRLQKPENLGGWLRTMGINKAIDLIRRRRNSVDVESISNDVRHAAEPDVLGSDPVRERVLEAVGQLGKAQRETVTLHYLGGYSIDEISALQGSPTGTVKARLHHARKKLRQELMDMVESTLQSQAPGEDHTQRILDVLSRHASLGWSDGFRELRNLGAQQHIDGFREALKLEEAGARRLAVQVAAALGTPDDLDTVADLIKAGLTDRNRDVRSSTVSSALSAVQCDPEQMRARFIPMAVDLLLDPSKQVRQRATTFLMKWVPDVPLDRAAQALLDEPHPIVRRQKEALLRAVLDHQSTDAPQATDRAFEQQLERLLSARQSPHAGTRSRAVQGLLGLAIQDQRRAATVVPLVVEMMHDPSRRVRWRAANELIGWAADVPLAEAERAVRDEPHERTRSTMQRLLDGVRGMSTD